LHGWGSNVELVVLAVGDDALVAGIGKESGWVGSAAGPPAAAGVGNDALVVVAAHGELLAGVDDAVGCDGTLGVVAAAGGFAARLFLVYSFGKRSHWR